MSEKSATGTQRELRSKLREGLHEYGEIHCAACGASVDLTGADDVEEAGEMWNDHMRDCSEADIDV